MLILQHIDLGLPGVFATTPPRRVSIEDLMFSPNGATVTPITDLTV